MLLGAHESVAGGLELALERAARDKAEAVQLWTRSSRRWSAPPLETSAISAFRAATAAYPGGRVPLAAHASYLIADEQTGTAVVVDPQRDIAQYVEETAR